MKKLKTIPSQPNVLKSSLASPDQKDVVFTLPRVSPGIWKSISRDVVGRTSLFRNRAFRKSVFRIQISIGFISMLFLIITSASIVFVSYRTAVTKISVL